MNKSHYNDIFLISTPVECDTFSTKANTSNCAEVVKAEAKLIWRVSFPKNFLDPRARECLIASTKSALKLYI